MGIGFGAVVIICDLAAFVLACRAIALACLARRPDGATGRLALLWFAACLLVTVAVPAFDRFDGSWEAALASCAGLVVACLASRWLGRRWREQAMEREAQRFAAECYFALQARGETGRQSAPEPPDYGLLCAQAARAFDLTRREEDVLLLLACGRSAAEVAEELVVSPNTVKTHMRNLYRKLGINRRRDLAARLGL